MASTDFNKLCLECGMCCNGVIFANGQLQPEDELERLRLLGLALLLPRKSNAANLKFHQPCAAFDGCRCRIYQDRPQYCRQFECLLMKGVMAGEIKPASASQMIRTALRRAGKVKRLLRKLGDTEEHAALSLRFRRMQRQFERSVPNPEAADLYGQLTLAVHDLNMLLSEAFYPG